MISTLVNVLRRSCAAATRQMIVQLLPVTALCSAYFASLASFVRLFTARRYASAVLAVIVCLSVRLSVRLSQVGVVQRWLNLGSH